MKSYVKKYMGHNVPEGATHYNEANILWPECFINADTGLVYILDDPRIWALSKRAIPHTAIELPEDPMPSKAEWVPNKTIFWVAKLDKYGTPWNSDGPHESYKDAESSIKLLDSLSEDTHTVTKMEFFCLKTAGEKKREAIKEVVINSIDTSKFKIGEMGAIAEFLNQMIDKFDVIPAGDK